MTAAQVQKCVVLRSNPLLEPSVLQHILGHVGPGHWFFLSTVSSLWRDTYAKLAPREIQVRNRLTRSVVTCVPQMTLFSAVFESPSRVRLAHESGVNFSTRSFQLAAGRHGTVDSLMTAHELGMEYSLGVMEGAAACNSISVLHCLHKEDCPWSMQISAAAARRGDLEMLHWLREHGCAWDTFSILLSAASSGNVEMMAWVKQQPDVVCNEEAIWEAACGGHTAVCEYMHAEGYDLDETACSCAARFGHVHTLRWLHEHGCPWDVEGVCLDAAEGGNIDVMVYLQQDEDVNLDAAMLTRMLNVAGAHDKLAAAQWLREQGAEWHEVLRCRRVLCAISWSGDLLQWAKIARLHITHTVTICTIKGTLTHHLCYHSL
jgi:hypothetical protein